MDDFHAFYDAGDDASLAYIEAWTAEPTSIKRKVQPIRAVVRTQDYQTIIAHIVAWLLPPALAPPRVA